MNLQDILNSRFAVALGLGLSRMCPPWFGYPFARWLADRVAQRKNTTLVRVIRTNQWVIHNQQPSGSELDKLAQSTLRSTARSLYDFYHFLKRPDMVIKLVDFEPSFQAVFDKAMQETQGTLLVAPHISAFDLISRAVALRGLPLQLLSYPQPPGGYQWQNHLRQLPNMTITPMSIQALQQASQTLRANRTVVTGIDRPLPEPDAKYRPRFFGLPASMPVFYIRLAIKHDLPITVLGACRKPDGRYSLWASEPIPMERCPDLVEETVRNAEKILKVAAEYICSAPEQWAMFYPVWPDMLSKTPV